MITKFILVLLSKSISKIRYSKYCLLYQITYTTIEVLLYQLHRFILTFTSNINMTCIYTVMHAFSALHLSISLMTKTILHKVFLRIIDYLYVSVNQYPQSTCFVLLYNYLLMCNAFVFYLKKQDI